MLLRLATTTLLLLSAGCSTQFQPNSFQEPQPLLEASEALFRRGEFSDAELGFRAIVAQLPLRDSLAVRARFLLGETLYAQGARLEAARQFRRVADEAPNSPLAPRALLRAGDAQAGLWKRPELDPTYGEAALVTYREVIGRFPRSPVAQRAGLKLAVLLERFAEKDFKNGLYYHRLRAFDSAILYFKNVVAAYGRTSYASRALVQLVEIYNRLEYDEEKQETCDSLRQFYADATGVEEVCGTAPGAS